MTIPYPACRYQAAGQSLTDAHQLIEDVHTIDPADVWARLSSWTPTRLACTVIALAAAQHPDMPLGDRLDWVRDLAVP